MPKKSVLNKGCFHSVNMRLPVQTVKRIRHRAVDLERGLGDMMSAMLELGHDEFTDAQIDAQIKKLKAK